MNSFRLFLLAVFHLGLSACLLEAEERERGAFRLGPFVGAPALSLPGEAERALEPGVPPFFTGALFRLRLEENTSAFLLASNGLAILTAGPAEFAVERFVQEPWGESPASLAGVEAEPAGSRLVLSQTGGEVAIDGSRQAAQSRLAMETPVGGIDAGRAVWSFSLVYDHRNRLFNFTLRVRGGEVRFSDRAGRSFNLYAGQRLSGVGSSNSPAIEIGEITAEETAFFEKLAARHREALEDPPTREDFARWMVPLREGAGKSAGAAVEDGPASGETARPITIDWVPGIPDPIPFRGLVRLRGAEGP